MNTKLNIDEDKRIKSPGTDSNPPQKINKKGNV